MQFIEEGKGSLNAKETALEKDLLKTSAGF